MGQIPAKQFPAPASFGDSQLNTLRQAQGPDKIQQQQMPSLGAMTGAAGGIGGAATQQAAQAPTAISNLRRAPLGGGSFGKLFGNY